MYVRVILSKGTRDYYPIFLSLLINNFIEIRKMYFIIFKTIRWYQFNI